MWDEAQCWSGFKALFWYQHKILTSWHIIFISCTHALTHVCCSCACAHEKNLYCHAHMRMCAWELPCVIDPNRRADIVSMILEILRVWLGLGLGVELMSNSVRVAKASLKKWLIGWAQRVKMVGLGRFGGLGQSGESPLLYLLRSVS